MRAAEPQERCPNREGRRSRKRGVQIERGGGAIRRIERTVVESALRLRILGPGRRRVVLGNDGPIGATAVDLARNPALISVALELISSGLCGVISKPLDGSSFSEMFLNYDGYVTRGQM